MDLSDSPCSLAELRRKAGAPPQTTMRGYLRTLAATGVLEKHRRAQFPGAVHYELTAAGHELAMVAKVLAAWLAASPEGPAAPGSSLGRRAVKALAEGWTTGMLRALASRPLSLTELDRVIVGTSYPSLERRLSSMRLLGLVEAMPGSGRGTPYAASDWLRRAVVPLTVAARWERRRLRERAPAITNRDIEAAFLLILPLLRMPENVSGSCRLAVHVGSESRTGTAGVIATVRNGSVVSTGTRLGDSADAWALGSASAWLSAVIERDPANLELGGETGLAAEVVERIHGEFGPTVRGNGRELLPLAPLPIR